MSREAPPPPSPKSPAALRAEARIRAREQRLAQESAQVDRHRDKRRVKPPAPRTAPARDAMQGESAQSVAALTASLRPEPSPPRSAPPARSATQSTPRPRSAAPEAEPTVTRMRAPGTRPRPAPDSWLEGGELTWAGEIARPAAPERAASTTWMPEPASPPSDPPDRWAEPSSSAAAPPQPVRTSPPAPRPVAPARPVRRIEPPRRRRRSPAVLLGPLALALACLAIWLVIQRSDAPSTAPDPLGPQLSSTGTAAATRPTTSRRTYVVRLGDSPSQIAERTGVPVDRLLAANDIRDASRLRVGQRLKLPR